MSPESDRAFHLERAEQCRRMADECADPSVRRLHVELAEFHEAEAQRFRREMPEPEVTS
jgi:hypothetical protein